MSKMADQKNANEAKQKPTNSLVSPLLTDMYQITMAYGYWKSGRHAESSVFELFFRKNPFKGEFTIFCGMDEVLKFINTFKFSPSDIAYLRTVLPQAEEEFFAYLAALDCSEMRIFACKEGSVVFPRIPLIRLEGPLIVGQLLETTLLCLVNYPSLICTNAARFCLAAGKDKEMLEFGLRRAQGPDGGFSASKYSIVGGFDGTSNMQAGKLLGVKVKGTHGHSYVQAFTALSDLKVTTLAGVDFLEKVLSYRRALDWGETNDGELAAFISYAISFPNVFLCLVDTYDTLASGVKNFILVALALDDLKYEPRGIRLDSGDLAYLSLECAKVFQDVSANLFKREFFAKLSIVASNDINEVSKKE
jgi:nicotinate phosphoribosyltransferase